MWISLGSFYYLEFSFGQSFKTSMSRALLCGTFCSYCQRGNPLEVSDSMPTWSRTTITNDHHCKWPRTKRSHPVSSESNDKLQKVGCQRWRWKELMLDSARVKQAVMMQSSEWAEPWANRTSEVQNQHQKWGCSWRHFRLSPVVFLWPHNNQHLCT